MTRSDWGDWLPRAVEAATPTGVSVWYLGCNGFICKAHDGTTLFIDPYLGVGDPPRTVRMIPVPFDPDDVGTADAVLVTHEHSDHLDESSLAPILSQTGARLYAPERSVEIVDEEGWTDRAAFSPDQVTSVSEGDAFEVGSFSVTVGPSHDPDADDPVSFVIDHPAGTIFHAGDSKPSTAFEAVGATHDIDIAIVAFGSEGNILDRAHEAHSRTRWYCDENEAVAIARALRSARLLPSHWDMWRGLRADPTALVHHIASWAHPRTLELVEIGDRIEL